jgi:hypothetical protein
MTLYLDRKGGFKRYSRPLSDVCAVIGKKMEELGMSQKETSFAKSSDEKRQELAAWVVKVAPGACGIAPGSEIPNPDDGDQYENAIKRAIRICQKTVDKKGWWRAEKVTMLHYLDYVISITCLNPSTVTFCFCSNCCTDVTENRKSTHTDTSVY